jgi:hypothetical protein
LNLQREKTKLDGQSKKTNVYFSAEFDASNLARRFMIELAAELRSSME